MKKMRFVLRFIILSLVLILTGCKTEEPKLPDDSRDDIKIETLKPEVHTHEFTAWVVIQSPTCTKTGTKVRTCSCGASQTGVVAALGHKLVHEPKVEATCTVDGHEEYDYCQNCDYTTYQVIEATGHKIVKVGSLEPTCSVVGHYAYEYCTNCNYTTYEEIPTESHSIVNVGYKGATCEEDGHEAYEYCKDCNYTTIVVIEATGHSLPSWVVSKAPTCTVEGVKTADCECCSHVEIEMIPALGHNLSYFEALAPTCTEAGHNAYETCSNCSHSTYEKIEATGHSLEGHNCKDCRFVLGVDVSLGDYTFVFRDGQLVTNNRGHDGTNATMTLEIVFDGIISFDYIVSTENNFDKFIVCINNEQILYKSGSHNDTFTFAVKVGDIVELIYEKDYSSSSGEDNVKLSNLNFAFALEGATCLTGGEQLVYDIATGAFLIEPVGSLGHEIIHHDGHAPTCTEAGYLAYDTCARCDYSTFEITAPPTGHTLHTCDAQAPTCLAIGWEAYEYCISCDYTTYEELPAKGHTLGEWEDQKVATCLEDGYRERKCNECSYFEYEYPVALGHDYDTTIHPVTCTTDGWTHYDCLRCGDNYDSDYISALGHNLAYYSGQIATCTSPGFNYYEECLREGCGYTTYEQTSPALGHNIKHCEAYLPTCTNSGYAAYDYCDRCDYSTYEYLDALGHDFGEWETVSEATCITPAIIEIHCSRCEEFDQEYDMSRPALGHVYGEEGIVEATNYTQGYKFKECGVCDYVYKYDFTETLLSGLFIFEEYGEGYQVVGTKLTPEHTVVEIPAEYNGKPVVAIKGHYSSSDTAFYGCDFIKVLIIPDSVYSIGKNALASCWNLEELTIPANATDRLSFIFDDRKFTNYDNSTFPSSLTKVTLTGDGSVNYRYFYTSGSNNISRVVLEEGITSIGSAAFVTCSRLTTISIPESLNSIASDGLSSCTSLIHTIYENGQYLGNEQNPYLWLRGVTDKTLSTYTIHPDTKKIDTRTFYDCKKLTDITIPESVDYIGNYAFQSCWSLKEIVIPDTVLTLGGSVFYDCSALTDVHLGSGIKLLNGTFYNCTSLKEIVIPEGVEVIGGGAFDGCTSLETIYLPASAIKFNDAYDRCYDLVNVYYGGTFEEWLNIDYSNATNYMGAGFSEANPMSQAENLYITNENGEYELVTEIHVAEGVEELNEYAYYGLNCVTTVYLPSTIKSIHYRAFAYCSRIVEVHTPLVEDMDIIDTFDSVQKVVFTNEFEVLPNEYFMEARALKSVVLPSTLKSIGEHAFERCYELEELVIPEGVTYIGAYAFNGCSEYENINFPAGVTIIEEYAFQNTGIKELVIPSTIKEIKFSGFGYCYALEKVVIPAELTNIAEGAFRGSKYVKEISMPVIGTEMGFIWAYNTFASDAPTGFDRVTIYGETIPFSYFSDFKIKEFVISDSITKFENYIVNGWQRPEKVYYLGTEEQWNNIDKASNDDLLYATIYYYTDSCIHEKDTTLWTYDESGNPTTMATVAQWVITLEPTCTADGSKEGHCIHCDEVIVESLPMISHTFADNKCSSCGLPTYYVTTGAYTFVNDGTGTFQSNNYRKNKTTATYIITANVTITIVFQYKVSSEAKYDFYYITANGKQITGRSGKETYFSSSTVTLYAGQELKFEYVKDEGTHSGDDRAYFKIDSITVIG